jgi:hypothetical protein
MVFCDSLTPTLYVVEVFNASKNSKRFIINCRKIENRKTDPYLRFLNSVWARILDAIKGWSVGWLFSRLGYSVSELMKHLERMFTGGMKWENYGKWHIDHIKPCAMFDQENRQEFLECWGLKNLQPLWAEENFKKSDKYVCP